MNNSLRDPDVEVSDRYATIITQMIGGKNPIGSIGINYPTPSYL